MQNEHLVGCLDVGQMCAILRFGQCLQIISNPTSSSLLVVKVPKALAIFGALMPTFNFLDRALPVRVPDTKMLLKCSIPSIF